MFTLLLAAALLSPQLEKLAADAQRAQEGRGDAALCAALPAMDAFAQAAEREFAGRAKRQDLALRDLLPGLSRRTSTRFANVFAEGDSGECRWYARADLPAAGRRLMATAGAVRLLDATASLLGTPPIPGWQQNESDCEGGPVLKALAEHLEKVAEQWAAAPECLRADLGSRIRGSLEQLLATTSYWIGSRVEAVAAAERIATLLARLGGLGGPELASRIAEAAAKARYYEEENRR